MRVSFSTQSPADSVLSYCLPAFLFLKEMCRTGAFTILKKFAIISKTNGVYDKSYQVHERKSKQVEVP